MQQQKLDLGHTFKSNNEIACTLSHLALLESFVNDPVHDRMLVFEDDVVIDANYGPNLAQAMNSIPPDWDWINFGRCFDRCAEERAEQSAERSAERSAEPKVQQILTVKTGATLCAHSYAVSQAGARKILSKAYPIRRPIDNFFVDLLQDMPSAKFFTVAPRLFRQLRSEEEKISSSSLDHFDRCPECSEDATVSWIEYHYPQILFFFFIVVITGILGYRYRYRYRFFRNFRNW